MITFFTTTRPFKGHMGIIQTNAIRSWILSCPSCEVILFGKDEGTEKVANKFGLKHIPDVECNKFGTPLVNSMFKIAQTIAKHKFLCLINADIMLIDNLLPAVEKVYSEMHKFVMVGRRCNVDIRKPWDFDQPDWQIQLRDYTRKYGKLFWGGAIDFFVFPKGIWGEIPPFAYGRLWLDRWFIYRARIFRIVTIDVTKNILAIHQNHEHVYYLKEEECNQNAELTGELHHSFKAPNNYFTVDDATHYLNPRGVRLILNWHILLRHLATLPIVFPNLPPILLSMVKIFNKAIEKLRRIYHCLKGVKSEF